MKGFMLSVLAFSAVLMAGADAIKCYVCTGTEDDCAKGRLEADQAKYLITCFAGIDRCMRTWAKKDNITAVATSCATKAVCDAAVKVCDDVKDGQCTVNCCDTDGCNANSTGSPTDGIKCFACVGTENECAKDKLEADKAKYLTTCPSSMDRCLRTWAKRGDQTAVVTSCATKAACDTTKKACDDVTDGQCTVSCCETDGCNANPTGSPTDGINCYDCSGTDDDCAKNRLEADKAKYLQTCPSSMDRCMRTWTKKDDKKAVENSCATKAICDIAKKLCDDLEKGQCIVDCCETDACNAGSAADGIKCFNCLGTKDACAKDKLERDKAKYVKTCPRPLDRCMLYWTNRDNQAVAMSSCADKTMCDATKQICNNSSDGHCAVSCCETDECNTVSSVAALPFSVFLMTFCFVLGLALFKQ